jgi:hypothetical protein
MFEKEIPVMRKTIYQINIKFGDNHRIVNCIEELSELQHGLCKLLRWNLKPNLAIMNPETLHNIIIEMADVYLTIEEVKYIMGVKDEEIINLIKEKINRGAF